MKEGKGSSTRGGLDDNKSDSASSRSACPRIWSGSGHPCTAWLALALTGTHPGGGKLALRAHGLDPFRLPWPRIGWKSESEDPRPLTRRATTHRRPHPLSMPCSRCENVRQLVRPYGSSARYRAIAVNESFCVTLDQIALVQAAVS